MKHRNLDYDVEEVEPSKWVFKIYPKIEVHPKVVSPEKFPSREAAIAACIEEIDNGLDGKNATRP